MWNEMKKYFQRRKLLTVCIISIVLLSLAFGYGPILKFFKVLTACLSEFKWVHNIKKINKKLINNNNGRFYYLSDRELQTIVHWLKIRNQYNDTFLRFGISQDADDVKIFIWTSRNRVEYKTIQIGILCKKYKEIQTGRW